MIAGKKHSLRERVEAALSEFHDDPQSVGFQFRLDLSTLLCELLDENDWTQKQLAEAAGMKEAVVSRIVNADSNCKFETAGRLLFALGVREGDVELSRMTKPVVQKDVIAHIGQLRIDSQVAVNQHCGYIMDGTHG